MDWNVKNAVNRDVERQHLNKILKEIRSGLDETNSRLAATDSSIAATQGNLASSITRVIRDTVTPRELATSVTLTGDVTGQSVWIPGRNAVTISTTLSDDFVSEAPIDANTYWRFQGQWTVVPQAVLNVANIQEQGIVTVGSDGFWRTRLLETGSPDRITIENPDGADENPIIDLAEVEDAGGGELLKTEFDAYGRKTGSSQAYLADLADVDDAEPEDGDVLTWSADAATWIPMAPTPGGFVPYYIPDGQLYTVPLYSQVLYTVPIELGLGAAIMMDGILAEVA